MANSLFNQFGGQMPGPMGNMARFVRQFQQFRSGFSGNPRAEVERLVREGKISQDEVNQVFQIAQQIGPGLFNK